MSPSNSTIQGKQNFREERAGAFEEPEDMEDAQETRSSSTPNFPSPADTPLPFPFTKEQVPQGYQPTTHRITRYHKLNNHKNICYKSRTQTKDLAQTDPNCMIAASASMSLPMSLAQLILVSSATLLPIILSTLLPRVPIAPPSVWLWVSASASISRWRKTF